MQCRKKRYGYRMLILVLGSNTCILNLPRYVRGDFCEYGNAKVFNHKSLAIGLTLYFIIGKLLAVGRRLLAFWKFLTFVRNGKTYALNDGLLE